MNKMIIGVSLLISVILVDCALSRRAQIINLKNEILQMQESNFDIRHKIRDRESLVRHDPVSLSTEYGLFMNQVKMLESTSESSMDVQLEADRDTDDIADHYVDTPYKGVKGLKIKIVVDKLSKDTDMGAVLDDIHVLEKNTDFMAWEISKDNNNLIVKGEIYGI